MSDQTYEKIQSVGVYVVLVTALVGVLGLLFA